MIEKKIYIFYKTKPKGDRGHANKKMIYCLSFAFHLNMKPIRPLVTRVTTRKTMGPFSATLRLDSQLRKTRGNPLPINTLPMNGMLVYVVT